MTGADCKLYTARTFLLHTFVRRCQHYVNISNYEALRCVVPVHVRRPPHTHTDQPVSTRIQACPHDQTVCKHGGPGVLDCTSWARLSAKQLWGLHSSYAGVTTDREGDR
jgi:hypothetical protein